MEENNGNSNWNRRQFLETGLAAAGLAAAPLAAQDVGMGKRKGGSKRLEAPYTLEIETPHVQWRSRWPEGRSGCSPRRPSTRAVPSWSLRNGSRSI